MNTFIESELNNPATLAKWLNEHNKWRRGVGKYKWHVNPSKNVDHPFSSAQLTLILNSTIDMLKNIAKSQKKVGIR